MSTLSTHPVICKGCRKCGGDLFWTIDYEEEYYKCLQCSRKEYNMSLEPKPDVYFKLTGNDYHLKKGRKDLKQVKLMIVSKTALYVRVHKDEAGFVEKVARDLDLKYGRVTDLPDYVTTKCGVNVLAENHASLTLHEAHCKQCRILKGKEPLPIKGSHKATAQDNGEVKTVAKIEPGQEFTLDGIINSLEITLTRLYAKVEELDTLLSNLKSYREKEEELSKLEQEARERLHAAKNIVSKL
ncbi:MAG: hypothetical protein ACWGQW_00550 [bacterium]